MSESISSEEEYKKLHYDSNSNLETTKMTSPEKK